MKKIGVRVASRLRFFGKSNVGSYRVSENRMTKDFAKIIIIRYIKDCRPKLIWYPPQEYVLQHLISVIRSPPPVSAPAVICCYAASSLTTNIDNYVRETVYVNGRGLVPFERPHTPLSHSMRRH